MGKQVVYVEQPRKDKIRVLVKQRGLPYQPFYATVTSLKLNGTSVGLFGRFGKDGRDQKIEASEVVFRADRDLDEFVQFEVGLVMSRRRYLTPAPLDGETAVENSGFAGDLGQKLRRRLAAHPSIKVDQEIFAKM